MYALPILTCGPLPLLKRFLDQQIVLLGSCLADSKFTSFVRQLNFYGFRKVKSNTSTEGLSHKWWEFKVSLHTENNTRL